jgi:hypothetical protein
MKTPVDVIEKAAHNAMIINKVLAAWSIVLCLLTGCASPKSTNSAPRFSSSEIQEVHILTTPFAVNFDQVGGPDGFAVRVYAGNPQNVKPFEITQGSLEILMFDGVVPMADIGKVEPLRTWKYSAREIKNYMRNTSIGTSYTFTPVWEKAEPQKGKITVVVCYTSTKGMKVYSSPSSIAMPMGASEGPSEIPEKKDATESDEKN